MNQNHIVQASLFDYANLDAETRIVVQQRTEELKTMFRRTAEDIVQIGRKLDDVRGRLRNGQFENWLRQEFDMSRRTAYNFINVFEQFGSANFAQLDIAASALYVLAAPSTTEEARQDALQRAQAGETITHSTARQIVEDHKPSRYCAACGEQIAGDVQGKYCAGLHCKYQGTLRPDLQKAIDEETTQRPNDQTTQTPVSRVVTVPSSQPPATPPPPPTPRPEPRPAQPGKVVPTCKPASAPLPPKPAPVMRPIEAGPKTTVIHIRILPGEGPLDTRQIMASVADEGAFPQTMEGGTFADLHAIVDRLCTAFFADELANGDGQADLVEGEILASEPIA